jgi:hypothetical protein
MPLTWSISRENTLEACERRYFFEYVARARTNSRDGRLREIAVLKKVKTVSMWQGEVLHQLVAEYLRRGLSSRPDASRMIATAVEQMQRDWASSEKKRYREPLRGRRDGTSQDVLEDLGPLWSAAARGIESMPGAAGEVEDVAGALSLSLNTSTTSRVALIFCHERLLMWNCGSAASSCGSPMSVWSISFALPDGIGSSPTFSVRGHQGSRAQQPR